MNSRSAQVLAAALAFLLIVLIGATIFVLLSRPSTGPSPSPAASGAAALSPGPSMSPLPTLSPGSLDPGISPSPSAFFSPSPGLSPSPELSPSPTAVPTPSPTPTISPSPSPSPTPTPTLSPTSPQRELRLIDVGLDSRDAETRVERIVTFIVSGQSRISAALTNASAGGIQLCIWREAAEDERLCDRGRNFGLQLSVFDSGSSTWHVSMIGTQTLVSPYATLTVRFNSDEPRAELLNFRYMGTSLPEYNGFEAVFTTGDQAGMRIEAEFEGDEEPYTLLVRPTGGAPIQDHTSPPVTGFSSVIPLEDATEYRVSLRNPEEINDSDVPFVLVVLTWP